MGLLDKKIHIWKDILRSPVNAHVKQIVSNYVRDALQETHMDVSKLAESKEEVYIPHFRAVTRYFRLYVTRLDIVIVHFHVSQLLLTRVARTKFTDCSIKNMFIGRQMLVSLFGTPGVKRKISFNKWLKDLWMLCKHYVMI